MDQDLKYYRKEEILEVIPAEIIPEMVRKIKANKHNKELVLNEELLNTYLKLLKERNDFLSKFKSIGEMSSSDLEKAIKLGDKVDKAYDNYYNSSKRLDRYYDRKG